MMGLCGIGSECSYGVESVPSSAQFTHPVVHPGSDLLLGYTLRKIVWEFLRDL